MDRCLDGDRSKYIETVVQTLVPRLTGVEVRLNNANPGPDPAEVELMLLNAKGNILLVVSKFVPANDCEHVRFALPEGGWKVTPGQAYNIELGGSDGVFGWKYVIGGYKGGEASFNGKVFLRDVRASVLFRTFGTR